MHIETYGTPGIAHRNIDDVLSGLHVRTEIKNTSWPLSIAEICQF